MVFMHKSRVIYANGCLKMKWVHDLVMVFVFFPLRGIRALHMFRFEKLDLEMLTAWIVGDLVWISEFGY